MCVCVWGVGGWSLIGRKISQEPISLLILIGGYGGGGVHSQSVIISLFDSFPSLSLSLSLSYSLSHPFSLSFSLSLSFCCSASSPIYEAALQIASESVHVSVHVSVLKAASRSAYSHV